MNEAKLEVQRDVAIDLPGGPSEVVVVADGDVDPRIVELELAAQAEHGHDAVCRVVATLEEAEEIAPEHLVLLGECRGARGPRCGTRAPSSSARRRRSPPATTRPAATTCCRRAAGRARSAGSASRPSSSRSRRSGSRPRGSRCIRPTVEALAAAEGMPAHAAAVQR